MITLLMFLVAGFMAWADTPAKTADCEVQLTTPSEVLVKIIDHKLAQWRQAQKTEAEILAQAELELAQGDFYFKLLDQWEHHFGALLEKIIDARTGEPTAVASLASGLSALNKSVQDYLFSLEWLDSDHPDQKVFLARVLTDRVVSQLVQRRNADELFELVSDLLRIIRQDKSDRLAQVVRVL